MMDFFHTWVGQTFITNTAPDPVNAIKEFTAELKRHNDLLEKMRRTQLAFTGPTTEHMLSLWRQLED